MNAPSGPSRAEERYLALGYDRFYSLFKEINSEAFWDLSPEIRFFKIKDIFSIYTELIKYKPIDHILANDARPHAELLGRRFIKFIRNVLQHFPFFTQWDEVYVDRELVTALEPSGTIDKFLMDTHAYDTKFRVWNPTSKVMTYVDINLNTGYGEGHAVFLSNMLNEKDGVMLLCLLMRKYLDTQIEN